MIIGAPGSAIILSYFILKLKSKDRSASTFLYIWISLVDMIICLLSFASAVSDFNLVIQGIIALKRLDVKISRGNVIPSLNGSQLHSSHRR